MKTNNKAAMTFGKKLEEKIKTNTKVNEKYFRYFINIYNKEFVFHFNKKINESVVRQTEILKDINEYCKLYFLAKYSRVYSAFAALNRSVEVIETMLLKPEAFNATLFSTKNRKFVSFKRIIFLSYWPKIVKQLIYLY